jgi:serine/threonine-protein kinase mTOR
LASCSTSHGNSSYYEETEETNHNAIMILNRVKDKLKGLDFKNKVPLDICAQIDLLIKQATSLENVCEMFPGWRPWC